jgi:hypothetical protein
MRLEFKYFKRIKKQFGDYEISAENNKLCLRFGYWDSIDMDILADILPDYFVIDEELVDDDDDCGPLYCYYIHRNGSYGYEADLEAQDYDVFGDEKI